MKNRHEILDRLVSALDAQAINDCGEIAECILELRELFDRDEMPDKSLLDWLDDSDEIAKCKENMIETERFEKGYESDWLKKTLREASELDPTDAACDAVVLAYVLNNRLAKTLNEKSPKEL